MTLPKGWKGAKVKIEARAAGDLFFFPIWGGREGDKM
jgi:hypothetical protein